MSDETPRSLTPVGDYLRKRYPPNPGATHYLGSGDDPGCCAVHPKCIYAAAWREAARVITADLDAAAGALTGDGLVDRIINPSIVRVYRSAAEIARASMERVP